MVRVKVLENTCFRGCLVYLAVLVIIVAFSTSSLGGLSARFGLGAPSSTPGARVVVATPLAAQSISVSQEQPQSQLPAPLIAIPTQIGANMLSTLPTIAARAEGISGQATSPFYVVQSGDTLWGLADRFGTTVETLRSLNKLGDQFIRPGQLLYLPQNGR